MSFKIVCDSCTDLTTAELEKEYFVSVPLTIRLEDREFIDDDTFCQADFLEAVKNSRGEVKSACPAPEAYMKEYESADDIYVVTLSANLSGSYNSAVLAKNLYTEEKGEKNIHVFNSCSAACGQYLIAKKIEEYALEGMSFEQVVDQVQSYIDELSTYFTLETLEVLKRNGRLSKVAAVLADTLNIKPVMSSTPEGEIIKVTQVRGMNRAMAKMTDVIAQSAKNPQDKVVAVGHCNCKERAENVKEMLIKKAGFKDCIVIDTRGISSMYACDGGIIIAF